MRNEYCDDDEPTLKMIMMREMTTMVVPVVKMMLMQVDKKWSCDEDGVHISTMWSPIPRSFILIWTSSSFKARQ